MNYIKQLNAFWRRRQMSSLSSTATMMYLAILHFANVSGWKESFNLPNQMLMATCGVGRSELYRHRNQLISDGYIRYVSGRKGKAGTYTIIPLYEKDASQMSPVYETHNEKDDIFPIYRTSENEKDDIVPTYRTDDRTYLRTDHRTNNRTHIRNIHKLNINENINKDDALDFITTPRDARAKVKPDIIVVLETYCKKAYGRVDDGMLDIACELYLRYGLMKTIKAINVSGTVGGQSIGYARALLKNEVVQVSVQGHGDKARCRKEEI